MAPVPIAVLGAGNWGTTLAHLVASNGRRVRLWTRDAGLRDEINARQTNGRSWPGLTIAAGVTAVTDLGEAVSDVELIVIAVPSQGFRDMCRLLGDVVRPEQLVIHGTKGLEAGTLQRMSQILQDETCARMIGVIGGPNIAAEIAQGKPAGTVIASRFPRVIEAGRCALASRRLMVFGGTDLLGVELCGALKNVVAIGAGLADEMLVGENAKAFLVTRGMSELMQLAFAMGAEPMTLAGLAGIGDLMVTCASPLSRNHRIGVALARGERLDEAVTRLGMVAEGVFASSSACALAAAHHVEMPLFDCVDRILHHGLSPAQALVDLMRLASGRDGPRFGARAPVAAWRR
jgi:glycerol-3-phosphate dehydrogenase (NAD(P)+)